MRTLLHLGLTLRRGDATEAAALLKLWWLEDEKREEGMEEAVGDVPENTIGGPTLLRRRCLLGMRLLFRRDVGLLAILRASISANREAPNIPPVSDAPASWLISKSNKSSPSPPVMRSPVVASVKVLELLLLMSSEDSRREGDVALMYFCISVLCVVCGRSWLLRCVTKNC